MQLVEGDAVVQVLPDRSLVLASGRVLPPQDEVLWCTQASAAGWLAGTGLPTDATGFLAVDEYLRSDGGPAEVRF
jgi:selenide,water dikinase